MNLKPGSCERTWLPARLRGLGCGCVIKSPPPTLRLSSLPDRDGLSRKVSKFRDHPLPAVTTPPPQGWVVTAEGMVTRVSRRILFWGCMTLRFLKQGPPHISPPAPQILLTPPPPPELTGQALSVPWTSFTVLSACGGADFPKGSRGIHVALDMCFSSTNLIGIVKHECACTRGPNKLHNQAPLS